MTEAPTTQAPPQNIAAERTVLGSCMIDNGVIDATIDALKTEHFYFTDHQKIFEAIKALHSERAPVDFLSVCNHLEQAGELEQIGGRSYLAGFEQDVLTTQNPLFWVEKVLTAHRLRETIKIGHTLIEAGYGGNNGDSGADPVETASTSLRRLEDDTEAVKRGPVRVCDIAHEVLDGIDRRIAGDEPPGLNTGYSRLDNITTGFMPGELVVWTANRTSAGKTAFALNVALNFAAARKPGAIFSLEMTKEALHLRTLSLRANVAFRKLKMCDELQQWEIDKLIEHTDRAANWDKHPIIIDDSSDLTTEQFRARARSMVVEDKIEWIIVDYIQLMSLSNMPRNANREIIVNEIGRTLKAAAGELKIPVFALSQVNKDGELRDSRALEQHADFIIKIERKEDVRKIVADEDTPGEDCFVVIEKSRNGACGRIPFLFQGAWMMFSEVPKGDGPVPMNDGRKSQYYG